MLALFACALSACALPPQSIAPHDPTAPLLEPDTARSVRPTPMSAPEPTPGTQQPLASVTTSSSIPPSTIPPSTVPRATTAELTVGFGDRNQIDDRYTCAGANVSPYVAWDDVPDGTVETVVWMVGDAPPRGPAREHVQWAVAGIDPSVRSIAEGSIPDGSQVVIPYNAVCYPVGTQAYHFTVTFLQEHVEPPSPSDIYSYLGSLRTATITTIRTSGYRNLDPRWWV